jgi:competence protein ComEA
MRQILYIVLISVLLSCSSLIYAEPVNINTASAEELAENLKGVGPKKALAIIEYREANGPFFTAEKFTNVKGIGQKTLEKNRDEIIVREE